VTAADGEPLRGRTRPLAELDWIGRARHAPHFLGYPVAAFFWMLLLVFLMTLTEGVGVALLYPIIELMQSGESLVVLAQRSTVFRMTAEIFADLGIDLSLLSLMLVTTGFILLRQVLTYVTASLRVYYSQRAVERIASRTFQLFATASIAYAERAC
jgi:hypothetical protein